MINMRKLVIGLVVSAAVVNLAACGTIFYPERKGQVSGNIDPGVAVLDGIGLFFYLIPGVIAFAVDFSNGTIYLPHRKVADVDGSHKVDMVAAKGPITDAYLEQLLSEKAHVKTDLAHDHVVVKRASSLAQVKDMLALAK